MTELAQAAARRDDAPMRIDVWSDVVCPWCWIGKRRLARGLALLGDAAPAVDLRWHPFLLDPDAGTEPVPLREAYARKFGGPERTAQLLANTQATARAEGLPVDFDRGQVRVTTLPAHRLLWLATREGDVDAVAEALFEAHFAKGLNLADPAVLRQAGLAGGLDGARLQAFLDGDEGRSEVLAQVAQAQAMGVRSVPTFLIDGRVVVQGAQPPEAFAEALLRARGPVPPAGAGGGGGS